MAVYGLTGVGTIPSILYFGIDSFYPGGWDGAMSQQQSLYEENKAINPDWKMFPKDF